MGTTWLAARARTEPLVQHYVNRSELNYPLVQWIFAALAAVGVPVLHPGVREAVHRRAAVARVAARGVADAPNWAPG